MKSFAMKRFTILFLILLLALAAVPAQAVDCGAEALILYEPRTGTVLEERNADARMLIASTTKIMTALVVIEHCPLYETVQITESMTGAEGSSLYLKAGQEFSVEELLYGLMLASANDAGVALAVHTAGSVEAFADLMNAKAAALGLQNTHYVNPHGLDAPEHYSSARDLALLTAAAMQNPVFCRFFSAQERQFRGITVQNHNKLLAGYPGCIGGKTGYTRGSGRTLVSCAERDGLRLICVTLADPDDWDDHSALYDAAFAEYAFYSFPLEAWNSVPVISSAVSSLSLRCSASYALVKKADAELLVELPRFVFAPVAKGDVLGGVTLKEQGREVLHADLTAAFDATVDPELRLRPWERFQSYRDRLTGNATISDFFAV